MIRSLLLSRNFVLLIIILLLGSILLSVLLPQKMTASKYEIELWLDEHPMIAPFYKNLGLDHVFTTPWFGTILAIFLLILIISSIDQIKISWRRTFGRSLFPTPMNITLRAKEDELRTILRKSGYILTSHNHDYMKFIKHPWGNWGSVLLHIGMVIVIGSSLLLKVTESRGLLHLVQGESYLPGEPWVVEDSGIFSKRFILPVSVRLEKINVQYWDTDGVRDMSLILSITDPEGNTNQFNIGINRNLNAYGLRIYLGRRYGDAFFMEFRDMYGHNFQRILQIEHPIKRDRAGYGNFFIEGIPYMIKAKYYADAEKETIMTTNPLLVLRLIKEKQKIKDISLRKNKLKTTIGESQSVIAELSLKKGEQGHLGPYFVKFVDFKPWSGIIFVRSKGMTGIFLGFFIIIIGVTLTYFFPSREISVLRKDRNYELKWRALKFEKFYEEEFERISQSLKDIKTNE